MKANLLKRDSSKNKKSSVSPFKTFGNKYLLDYIMPCIESLISNNSNEFKIIELIKAINQFFETGYLKPNETAFYFNKLVHFYLHPFFNYFIKNKYYINS